MRGTLVPAFVGVRESQEVVPLYYPVPIPSGPSASPETPAAPPKPYDPTRSRILIIGAGSDGGGGALRVTRADAGTLSLTWLGTVRPTRDVRVFVADSLRETLREQQVTVEHPTARIRILDLGSRVAFSGVTVHFADGAIATTLVPIARDSVK